MGQKVNPISMRLGINQTWRSRWYASGKAYGDQLHEDLKLRERLMTRLKAASISRITIERSLGRLVLSVYSARPGVVIGKRGSDIEELRKDLTAETGLNVGLNIIEVRKAEIDAALIAETVAQQLERRFSFRRALRRAVQNAMRQGAGGVRINVAGRLGGAEIARTEWHREGRVPLHTLRSDIDYGFREANTSYGQIGVKVWVYRGEIAEHDPQAHEQRFIALQSGGGPSASQKGQSRAGS